MSDLLSALGRLSDQGPEAVLPGIYDAVVTKSTAEDLHFIIPSFSRDHDFGPTAYPRLAAQYQTANAGDPPHSHVVDLTPLNNPPKGTKCVVAFADGDPDKPRVLSFLGWP